jgi:DNA repair protein RadC
MLPREKLLKDGVGSLSNKDLIAVILGCGSRESDVFKLSEEVDEKYAADYTKMTYSELMLIKGMGEVSAMRLCSACELFTNRKAGIIKIKCPQDAVNLIGNIRDRRQEHFLTITLNGSGGVIQKRTVFIGTLNKSLVHPREIFADAISDRASGIIIIHNHPSGELEPSREDIFVTEKLVEGGKILGIEILVHLIVTSKSFYSFKENGKI